MQKLTIPIANILVGSRQRIDYGDLEDLAASLERYGLIQPIVIDEHDNLIAGGRRLAAATRLGWTEIPVVYRDSLTEDERAELELEENVRRKDMTWQERCLAIASIHNKKQLSGALEGSSWGQRETGELLGMTLSNVSYALMAAKLIASKDPDVGQCTNMNDVMKLLLQRKEDEVLKSLAAERPTPAPVLTSNDTTDASAVRPAQIIPLRLHHSNALDLLDNLLPGSIDHVVTDPPYGIDMDNLQQDNIGMNVERTRAEHDVEENLSLLRHFLPRAFRVTRDHSFCVLWCDQDNWELLKQIATDVGWRVQRWPLVWLKTDPCTNGAPTFNFTKKTEIAMVLRKPGATLNAVQTTNYFMCPGEDKALFSHPFAKPRELWQWVLLAVSQPGQLILDPFAGSGTCPVACVENDRLPMAGELVDHHFNELTENLKRAYKALYGDNTQFI